MTKFEPASTEPLYVIIANECNPNVHGLTADRFRRVVNELSNMATIVKETSEESIRMLRQLESTKSGAPADKPKIPMRVLADVLAIERRSFIGKEFRHKKSGEVYVVIDVMLIEADMSVGIMYRAKNHLMVSFMRPKAEFELKFERLG